MLRASSRVFKDGADAVGTLTGSDPTVPHGPLLLAFVDAVVTGDASAGQRARAALAAAAGPAAVVDAAAVLANFEMMTRVADGTGARQSPERVASLDHERAALDIDRFSSRR